VVGGGSGLTGYDVVNSVPLSGPRCPHLSAPQSIEEHARPIYCNRADVLPHIKTI